MQPELQEYFEALLDLFVHPGWEVLMEDMQEGRDQLKLEYCDSVEEFWKAKGKIDTFDRFLGYQEAIRRTYEEYDNVEDI